MKRLLCLAFVAISFLAAAAPAAEPLTAPQRAELLGRLQALHAKHPSFQAAFSEQRTSSLLKKPLISTGRIAFEIPNKFRREVTGANPSLTLSNGRELWLYYPNFQEAQQYTRGNRKFDEILDSLTDALNFTQVEEKYQLEATPEGDGGYRLVLTPKRSMLKRIIAQLTVTLDKDLNVRCTDLVLLKGDHVVTTYSALRREALPPATFEFAPPPGTNISRPMGK